MASATGAISTAVAVFEMNSPSNAVIPNRVARTSRGDASPVRWMTAFAARSTPPVR